MSICYNFYYVAAFIVEPILWIIALSKSFQRKYDKKYYILSGVVLFLIFYVKQMLLFNNIHSKIISAISLPVQIVYLYVIIKLMFTTTIIESLITVGVFSLISIITDSVTFMVLMPILNVSLEDVSGVGVVNLLMSYVARILEIFIYVMFLSKIPSKMKKIVVNNKEIIPVIVANFVIDIPILIIYNNIELVNFNLKFLQILYLGSLIIFSITTFYVIFIFLKARKKENESLLKINKMEMQLQMYSEISAISDNLRKMRHDMGVHIGLLKSLCEQSKYDELQKVLNKLYKDVQIAEDIIILENKSIAALLNQKCKIAKEKGVKITPLIMIADFKMDEIDACSVLSNILDNAIEAASKVNEGYVHLSINPNEQGYSINCENSFLDVPVMKKNRFLTTKQNIALHGLGIEIVRDIVKKYHGISRFYYKENCFFVEIHIP